MSKAMLMMFGIVLIAGLSQTGAAIAAGGGGGGAEPMPGTNYTDLPPYHPYYNCRIRRSCAYLRSHPRVYDYWAPRY
jgi:hypothetical protein